MALHVGQKVEWIAKLTDIDYRYGGEPVLNLQHKTPYTIVNVYVTNDSIEMIELAEIPAQLRVYGDVIVNPGFKAAGFRPITEQKTSIWDVIHGKPTPNTKKLDNRKRVRVREKV